MATLRQKGRAIRQQEQRNLRNEATIDGVRPRKGLWIVHPGRGRVYGRIVRVKRDGTVVWVGEHKVPVRTRPATLINDGYAYREHVRVPWEVSDV